MARRPGSHRADHASPLVDLDVVFADDRLIDSIAAGLPESPNRVEQALRGAGRHAVPGRGHLAADSRQGERAVMTFDSNPASADPLFDLFQSWRYELASEPMPPVPSVHHAADAVDSGRVQRKRSLRPALAIAAAIAALLFGTATVGSKDAAQDSALWGITQVLWPERAVSVASRDHVRTALDEATRALAAGDTQQAQLALLRAAVELGKVADVDGRGGMQQQVDELWRVAAPRGLSGTSLSVDPLTRQLLADGPPERPAASAADASASLAGQSLSRNAPPAVLSSAGGAPVTHSPQTGIVQQGAGNQGGGGFVDPDSVAPSRPASSTGVVSGTAAGGGVPPVPAAATPPVGAPTSESSAVSAPVLPPTSVPVPEPSPTSTVQAPVVPATPTPPNIDPTPVQSSQDPSPTSPNTVGTTAPAPAPAPTSTGADPTITTATTTTTTTTVPAPAPAENGFDPLPQSPAQASSAG